MGQSCHNLGQNLGKSKASVQLATEPPGTWVQVEKRALEKWAKLTFRHQRAAALMHVLVSRVGRHNAVVVSQPILAKICGCNPRTIRRAIKVLVEQNWIEVRQIGPAGTVNAYVINDRVAWSGKRDGIRYSLFSAAVLVADNEQVDRDTLSEQPPLEQVPYVGEQQLPTGPGLDPPSSPQIPGLETDLPARLAPIKDV